MAKTLAGTKLTVRDLGSPDGRTNVYDVVNAVDVSLGMVQWDDDYGYALYPNENTLFDIAALRAVAQFCEEETQRHREARKSS